MITIKKYTSNNKQEWNEFNKNSKNSIFMFDRDYMDYHSDRFIDNSLMFYENDKLVALLPMNIKDNVLYSHGGLTYGGFITSNDMKQHIMNDCFNELISYARENSIKEIIYKTIPYIYHKQASEEDRYALYANKAELVTIDASTYVNLRDPLKMPKGRKAQIARAKRENVEVKELYELNDFNAFIELENEVLSSKHDTKAVHTGKELKMLRDSFPNSIHLFGAFKDNKLISGVVVYEYDTVIHTQYMAANEEARELGALDLIIDTLINKYKDTKDWLDFGISTEHNRIYLNEGLIHQKEAFGGRTGAYEIWIINI